MDLHEETSTIDRVGGVETDLGLMGPRSNSAVECVHRPMGSPSITRSSLELLEAG